MSIDEFDKLCRSRSLSYEVSYSEAEDLYEVVASGIGEGEYWRAKKIKRMQDALSYVAEEILK